MGFRVSKPWGDSERYDLVVNAGGRLWRVHLKSTAAVHARGYEVQPIYSVYSDVQGRNKAGYSAEEIDVLVVHIRPREVWYVIPERRSWAARICDFIRTLRANARGGRAIGRRGC